MKEVLVFFGSLVLIVAATCAIVEVANDRAIERNEVQLSVGKRIKSISTSEKPCVIVFDDGSKLEFNCYKYSPRVEYSRGSE